MRLLGSGVWLLGLAAQTAGVLLQAAALDRGRVAVIQPLLVTAVVWAMPLGYFLTGQVITVGTSSAPRWSSPGWRCSQASATPPPAWTTRPPPTGSWPSSSWGRSAGLLLFSRRDGSDSKAAVFGAVAGILYGISATLMKPVVENLHAEGAVAVLESWELWVMAIGGLVGFYIQQLSLATGKLVTSVATVSVVNPVVSVLLGALVLQERLDRDPPWHAVVAVGALAVALLGAVVAASASRRTRRRRRVSPPPPEAAAAGARRRRSTPPEERERVRRLGVQELPGVRDDPRGDRGDPEEDGAHHVRDGDPPAGAALGPQGAPARSQPGSTPTRARPAPTRGRPAPGQRLVQRERR